MSAFLGLRHILRSVLHRTRADDETREELAYHLERQTAKHVAAGLAEPEARRLARLELGGVERWREETAATRRGMLLLDVLADARYALRGLAHRPGFALPALATLAVGIGAATAVFAVANGALLRPLPFPNGARLMSLSLRMPVSAGSRFEDMSWSYPKFVALRDGQRVFDALALYSAETVVVGGSDGAARESSETAGAAYFDVLGVHPALGRTYTADEDRVGGAHDVVVLSDAYWRSRFGAQRTAVGRTLEIGGVRHTIVGVMPAGFRGLSGDAAFWTPITASRSPRALEAPDIHNLQLVGRLAAGVSPAAAARVVARLGTGIDARYPSDDGQWGAAAYALSTLRVNPAVRRSLQLLAVAAGLLLAIVCVNVSMLLVTRGAARRQEMAIRVAVGGGRGRLVRQLATETTVLTALGGMVGVLLAAIGTRVLVAALPRSMPTAGSGADLTRLTFSSVHLGLDALLVAVLLTVAIGAGLGALSAMRVSRGVALAALRATRASPAAIPGRRSAFGTRNALVTAQVALATAFLVASGLTLQSLRRTLAIPLGFQPDGLLTVKLTLDPLRARDDSTPFLWEQVMDELRTIPGVRAAAAGSCSPVGMHCDGTTVTLMGRTDAAHVTYLEASPGYFTALGSRLVRGRTFDADEASGARRALIINQAAARRIWGAVDPLTTPLQFMGQQDPVVGIVEDVRYEDIERAAEPAVYAPFGGGRGVLFIRVAGDAGSYVGAIRRAIRRAGRGHAMGAIQQMPERLRDATIRERLSAQVFTVFALCALLLATVGVYGTLALQLSQRSRELAIRRALGASGSSLARIVARQVGGIVIAGGIGGAVLALAAGRGLSAMLYDVRTVEPRVFAASAVALVVAVTCAGAIPAWRALRTDPRRAMTAE